MASVNEKENDSKGAREKKHVLEEASAYYYSYDD